MCFMDLLVHMKIMQYWLLIQKYIYLFQIFTEDLPEVETLPREKVMNYLEKLNKNLAVSYLVSCNQH